MSAAGPQLSPKTRPDLGSQQKPATRKSALARLLHALNQPLTGLQCSIELALALPARPEQYLQTFREALELANRMRMLVAAIRELIDMQESAIRSGEVFGVHELLAETADEVRPIAASRQVGIGISCDPTVNVAGDRRFFAGLIFRLMDSLISLAVAGSDIAISGQVCLGTVQVEFRWSQPQGQQTIELCPAEIGLLLVEAGCEQIGARFERRREEPNSCRIWLAAPGAESGQCLPEDLP